MLISFRSMNNVFGKTIDSITSEEREALQVINETMIKIYFHDHEEVEKLELKKTQDTFIRESVSSRGMSGASTARQNLEP